MRKTYVLSLLASTFLTSCAEDQLPEIIQENQLESQIVEIYGSLEALTIPMSDDYSSIPQDPKNMLTEEKVALGQMLFHETGIALNSKKEIGKGTYSCASCHHAKAGFQSGLKQGIGEGGSGFGSFGEARKLAFDYDEESADFQPLRTPTAMNVAYQEVMLWNGQFGNATTNNGTETEWTEDTPKETNLLGFQGVETQAIAGLDVHRLKCEPEMIVGTPYQAYFDAAFPDVPEDLRYKKIQAGLAIAAYERTLLSSQAPFQKWLRGNSDAMNTDEKLGAALFFGKANCYNCHSGPALNDMDFHALGMQDLSGNGVLGTVDEASAKGRGGFTKNNADNYKFKTPTLYNLKDVHFLGHGGSFTSVEEVIRYKNKAEPENENVPKAQLSTHFTKLFLSENEIAQLTSFVENALYDPELDRYVPSVLPTGKCFPVADDQSKIDMGCD